MTLTSEVTRIDYAGDGATIVFPVPFAFYGPDELVVWQQDVATTDLTQMVRGTDYTVSGGSGAIGTVTATAAPAGGLIWSIVRDTTPTQQVGFNNADPLPAPTLERAFDRLTAVVQEMQAQLARTVRASAGEQDEVTELPSPADRASKVLAFDSAGNPTASTLASGTVAVSSAMEPVIAAASVASARDLLGARAHVDLVRDHAADPTGTLDCSAALQAAINSLTSGIVYLRPGSYRIASDVTLKPNVTVIGDDPLTTQLVAGANNVKLLKYTAAAAAANFTIRRLGFSYGGYTGVYGVHIDGTDATKRCAYVSLEDLYTVGCARGINLRFCAVSAIEGARCLICTVGLYIDTCFDTDVRGGWANSGTDYGLYITGSGGAADESVRVASFSTNGQTKGAGINGQDWGQMTGCAFLSASGGPLTFIAAENWKVSSCDLVTGGGAPATPGISTDVSCSAIQLVGNRAPLNSYGFDLQGTKHVVTGNHFSGNGNSDIRLRCTSTVVQGNLCDSTGAATSIEESGTADYNAVSGNVTNGTVTIIGANSASNGNNVVY